MTLPSQTGRASRPSARVTRKRRRGKGSKLTLLVLLLAVCVGGYFAWDRWFRDARLQDQLTDTSLIDTNPYNAPMANSPVVSETPNHTIAMPSSYTPPAAVMVDAPVPATPHTPAPILIPLPQITTGSDTVNTLPPVALPPITSPQLPPTNANIQDTPTPVLGTPVLAPQSPRVVEDANIASVIAQSQNMIKQGQKLEARTQLSYLLLERFSDLSQSHASTIRTLLKQINQELVFPKRIIKGDPIAQFHIVRAGDYLGPIANSFHTTHQFLERINKVKATRIWVGMKLKIIKGPFHVIVDKSDYLMDIYVKDDKGNKVFIANYPVGLGEQDSTPIGMWRIRPNSKVSNPAWPDPRTGKLYQPDDPKNPIGEYWIGIQGLDSNTQGKKGYGIHGTTDTASIGQQMSMGCIRLRADDLAIVYTMLVDKHSTVQIRR
ncbi:MAG: L,D-transpeptidase family protein [Phycisphaeraceae bacterium]|nr:L,D-transpeptidase family protein [Phycisphaeraceae bacterium]